jgi:hypothetical protein
MIRSLTTYLFALVLFAAGSAVAAQKPQPAVAAKAAAIAGAIAAQQQQQSAAASVSQAGDVEARLAPGFSAPSLAASDEACMGSTSGGVGVTTGVIGVSATFGSTWESWNCNLRMFAQQLRLAGAPDAALLILANHPEVKAALVAAGRVKADPPPAPRALAPPSAPAAAQHPACAPRSWASREWRAANC